jgi:DNA (cytosine-5)-methyltransferase 1
MLFVVDHLVKVLVLAGKRKKFDKKDDLFAHYLNVIRVLRPKYFVMENVKGILTKESGKIKEMILQEIKSNS